MKKILIITIFTLFIISIIGGSAFSMTKKDKKAILLVAFGTSYKEARVSYDNIEKHVKSAFPDIEVRWAYTSNMIRKKILSRDKLYIPDPIVALSKLQDEGFTKVIVQSLHVIPGYEFEDLSNVVSTFGQLKSNKGRPDFKVLVLGKPIMYDEEATEEFIDALSPFIEENKDKAIVFMGHGTEHFANAAYSQLELLISERFKNVVIGTVEGYPDLDFVKEKLKEIGKRNVVIAPLMIVAGDHARNDMAGDEADSWKMQLKQEGYKVEPFIHGLGENDKVAEIFVKRIKENIGLLK